MLQWGASSKFEEIAIILSSPWKERLEIFSLGREAWNLMKSRLIPRNSKDVEGPEFFSGERGTPNCEKTLWTVHRCSAGGAWLRENYEKIIEEMNEVGNGVVFLQDPAESF